jgi:hypothetical protein
MGRWIHLWMAGLLFWLAASLAQDPSVVLPQGEIRGVSCFYLIFSFFFYPFFHVSRRFFFLFSPQLFPSLSILTSSLSLMCAYRYVQFSLRAITRCQRANRHSGHLSLGLQTIETTWFQPELCLLTRLLVAT